MTVLDSITVLSLVFGASSNKTGMLVEDLYAESYFKIVYILRFVHGFQHGSSLGTDMVSGKKRGKYGFGTCWVEVPYMIVLRPSGRGSHFLRGMKYPCASTMVLVYIRRPEPTAAKQPQDQ